MSRDMDAKDKLLDQLTKGLHKYGMRTCIFQQNMAQKIGVVQTDLKTADILNETGPITAGELARITGLSTGSVTALVDRLEKAGYVKRKRDDTDRRRVMIVPIPSRHQEIMAHYQALSTETKRLCRQYDEGQIELILKFVADITTVMDAENKKLSLERE